MKKKKIIFRCDGANLPEIGTGNVSRCINLANTFVKSKFCNINEIGFVTRRNKFFDIGYRLVKQSSYFLEKTSDQNLKWNTKNEAEVLKKLNPSVLIIDRLSTKYNWMKMLSNSNFSIVSFDDNGSGTKLADIVINGVLHRKQSKKNIYVGYDYLFLDDVSKYIKKKIKKKVRHISVSFGGYDDRNLIGFFIQILKKKKWLKEKKFEIDLLVGQEQNKLFRKWQKEVKNLNNYKNIKVNLLVRPKDYLKRLSKADLAILSGGHTVFYALSMGVPVIGLPQYKHQLKTLKNLEIKGAVKLGSKKMRLDKKKFISTLESIINSFKDRKHLHQKGKNLIDGKGSRRVIDILSSLLKN